MGEDASKSCRKRLGPRARQDRVEGAACAELWSQQAEEIWGRGTLTLSSDSLPGDSSTKVVEKGRGRRSSAFPDGNRRDSPNKAGRGCTRELLRVVQGQLEACGSQRAGGLPSPVSRRGHRGTVGGACGRYKAEA